MSDPVELTLVWGKCFYGRINMCVGTEVEVGVIMNDRVVIVDVSDGAVRTGPTNVCHPGA